MRRFGYRLLILLGLGLLAAYSQGEPLASGEEPPVGLATLVIEGKTVSFIPRGTEVLAFKLEGARLTVLMETPAPKPQGATAVESG